MENHLDNMFTQIGIIIVLFLLVVYACVGLISWCELHKGSFQKVFNLGQISEIRLIPGGYTEIKIENNTYTFQEYNELSPGQTIFLKRYKHKFCISEKEHDNSHDRLILKINGIDNHDTFFKFFSNFIKD